MSRKMFEIKVSNIIRSDKGAKNNLMMTTAKQEAPRSNDQSPSRQQQKSKFFSLRVISPLRPFANYKASSPISAIFLIGLVSIAVILSSSLIDPSDAASVNPLGKYKSHRDRGKYEVSLSLFILLTKPRKLN